MSQTICTTAGVIGSAIAYLFGGWSTGLITLIVFMSLDYISGLVVAGVFHKSKKTESGALESTTCFKGLCKKGMMLLIVLVAYQLDLTVGSSYIRDTVIIAFIVNETISILENAKLMGIPIPEVIDRALDILKNKDNNESKEE